MANEKYAELEQKIADLLFKNHGKVLVNGEVDGIRIGIDFIEEVAGGRSNAWHWRNNGKVQIRVGSSYSFDNDSVGFRQKKDGTHSYDKIADKLSEMEQFQRIRNERKAKERNIREDNQSFVNALESELNLRSYDSKLTVSSNNGANGALCFKISAITQDQAREFVELAIEMGVIKPKSD